MHPWSVSGFPVGPARRSTWQWRKSEHAQPPRHASMQTLASNRSHKQSFRREASLDMKRHAAAHPAGLPMFCCLDHRNTSRPIPQNELWTFKVPLFFSTFWLRRLSFHFNFFDSASFAFCASSASFIVAMATSFCFSNRSLNSLCFDVASSICFSYDAVSSFSFPSSHAVNSSMKVFSFLLQCSPVETTHGSLELSLTNFLSLLYSRGPSYFSPSSPVSLLKYLMVGYPCTPYFSQSFLPSSWVQSTSAINALESALL